jgi:cyanophycin synthetase
MDMLEPSSPRISSFGEWRSWVTCAGLRPCIVVAGSRGKTIVARLLESILRGAGLRVAVWSSYGVDIDGIRQTGELGPWQEVEQALDAGGIDVAIREVDWATAASLATAPRIAMLAVTNVCLNRDDCVVAGDAQLANAAMPALLTAVVNQGWLVLNGEDLAVSADLSGTPHNRLLVGLGIESPTIEDQLLTNRSLATLSDDRMFVALQDQVIDLGSRFDLDFALEGKANFQVFNALMAASLAVLLGIDASAIKLGLRGYVSDPHASPGSFNILSSGSSIMILDRPSASWYLRPVLRALRDYHRARLLTVFSGLRGTLRDDSAEIGRLLGRISNILIVSDDEPNDAERIKLAMEGARRND